MRAAARKREHAQVFRIGTVDAPFLVRREEVERDFRIAVGHFAQQLLGGFGVHRRTVRAESRTEIAHPFVILVKLLAAGERAPRNQLVHVGVAGGVAHFFALHARPNRRSNNLARLGDDVAEADLRVLAGINQVRMVAAGDFAQRLPCFFRNMAVGFRCQRQNHLGRIDGGVDFRLAFARAFGLHAVEFAQVFHFVLGIPRHAFAVVVHFFQQGADRGEFLVNRAVVAFHHGHGRHGFARNRLALAQFPVFRIERLAEFLRAVVHQRREHDVFTHAQIVFGQLAEFFSQAFIDFPVGFALPQRLHRFGKRMDERVHVGRVQIVFLVPSGGRENHVGVQAGGVHAEIQEREQIQLAFHAFPLLHFGRFQAVVFVAHQAVLRAEQVFQEIFVAFAGGTQNVGTPNKHIARPVFRVFRIVAGHFQRAFLQTFHHIIHRRHAGLFGRIGYIQRIGFQLRRARRPTHAGGFGVVVDHGQAAHIVAGVGREQLVGGHGFVAVLAGVAVEERGTGHLARGAVPVERESQRRPAGLRTQFFLAHIMTPAAAGFADGAAHHQHVDQAAIVHVQVIPVVQAGADDNHRAAFGVVRVLGELAGYLNHAFGSDAGVFFLPFRRVGLVVKIIFGHVLVAQAVVHAVLRHQKVEHGGHQPAAAVGQGDAFHRYFAEGFFFVEFAAEVVEADAHHVIGARFQRQGRLNVLVILRLGFQIPLAAAVPTEADGTVGQHQAVGFFVPRQHFPVGVFLFAEIAAQLRRAQGVFGAVAFAVFFQAHQHRHIGQAAAVVLEIVGRIVDVEFFEDNVPHRHRQRGIRALARREPDVAELGHFTEVGRHGDGFGAFVAHFGVKMGVGGAGHRDVGTPHQKIVGVVPVGGFGHVGLFAPSLWRSGRQVAIPVVERQRHAAD